ncbi:MAG: hypothetical protein JWR84_2712 [Caulobacter sp.]|nr:hypothetical protein [Caulobacter sp.]
MGLSNAQRGPAETVGFDPALLAAIDRHYEGRVEAGEMAGLAWAVARRGQLVHASAIGFSNLEDRVPLKLDSVFRLMSMTKPLTAVALMMLYDEGRFGLDDPLTDYLPQFAGQTVLREAESAADDVVPMDRGITVRDVLRHTTGYGLGFGMGGAHEKQLAEKVLYVAGETLADEMAKISKAPLGAQPGAIWNYSLAPDIQARLVEVLSGVAFADFLQSRILDPLGMADTGFALSPGMIERLVRCYWTGPEGLTRWAEGSLPPEFPGIPWPEPLVRMADTSVAFERGAFGLSSTLGDYLKFAQMLLNGGELDGKRLLSETTVRLMSSDHLGDIPMDWKVKGLGFGLGFAVIKDVEAMGFAGTPGTFYWDGATGVNFWVDPVRDLVVVTMAQHLFTPNADPQALNAEMHDMIYAALTE